MNQQESQQKQILEMVVKALSEGAKPEELVKVLSEKGLPEEAATEMVKAGVGYMQQQQEPQSGQFAKAMTGGSDMQEYAYGAYTNPYEMKQGGAYDLPKAQVGKNQTGVNNPQGFDFMKAMEERKQNSSVPYAEVNNIPDPANNPYDRTADVEKAYISAGLKKPKSEFDEYHTYADSKEGKESNNLVPIDSSKNVKFGAKNTANLDYLKQLGTFGKSDDPWLTIIQGLANTGIGGYDMINDTFGKKQPEATAKYGGDAVKDFKPHMMYKSATGESEYADTYEKHVELMEKGYTHEQEMKWGGSKKLDKYQGAGSVQNNTPKYSFTNNKENKSLLGENNFTNLDFLNKNQNSITDPKDLPSDINYDFGESTGIGNKVGSFGQNKGETFGQNEGTPFTNPSYFDTLKTDQTEGGGGTGGPIEETQEAAPNNFGTSRLMLGLDQLATGLEMRKAKKEERKQRNDVRNAGNTMNMYQPEESAASGFGTANRGMGADFRLSEHNYGNYSKYGGLKKFLGGGMSQAKEGDEMMMTQEELEQFIKMGGQVEILDDNVRPRY